MWSRDNQARIQLTRVWPPVPNLGNSEARASTNHPGGRVAARHTPRLSPRSLCPILGSALLSSLHPGGVKGPAHYVIAHAWQVLHTPAAHKHNIMLLKVMSLAGNIGSHLNPIREAHPGDLSQRRIRLLRRSCPHLGTHPSLLRVTLRHPFRPPLLRIVRKLQCWSLGLLDQGLSPFAYKLIYSWQATLPGSVLSEHT